MKKKSSQFLQFMGTVILLLSVSGCYSPLQPDKRPNFLIIVTDDQRYDTMSYMPQTQSLIFDQGVTFSNGFVTTSLCCPSRASILTGMYAHNHHVNTNEEPLRIKTVMAYLHDNGYYTGLVGKYLNSWKGAPLPEYDYWVSYFGGETNYYDARLNVNGKWTRYETDYVTYVLGDYAIDFLKKATQQKHPFVLYYAPNAPHAPTTPAHEDEQLLQNLPPYRPPSFNEADVSGKPAWWQARPLLTPDEIAAVDKFRRDQLLTLIALDRTIGKVMAELKSTGQLDNTVIIFLSDNGMFWGEHRMEETKYSYYEEASHVPFALRYPPLVQKPYTESGVVGNIDIAPTLYDLAGIPTPPGVDGMSLAKLLKHDGNWREGILLEGWPGRGNYTAVRTQNYVYAETEGDIPEFYNLQLDPFEMKNVAAEPQYKDLIAQHQLLLHQLQGSQATPAP